MQRATPLILAAALAAFAGCGGASQTVSAPTVRRVEYDAQQARLQKEITRLETTPEKADPETLRLLKKLEDDLAAAELRHNEDQRRIAQLKTEVEELKQAAGFAVHHIQILWFTKVIPDGIDLWVTPFDRHNDAVKTAGRFEVSLHKPGMLGSLGRGLAEWEFSAAQVENKWEGELFEGYHLKLLWPGHKKPDEPAVRLRVLFTTAEGRTYAATEELNLEEASE